MANINFDKAPSAFVVTYMDAEKLSSPNQKSRVGDSHVRLEQFSQAIQLHDYEKIEQMVAQASISRKGNHAKGHNSLIIALQNFRDRKEYNDRHVVSLLLKKLEAEPSILVEKLVNTRTDKEKLTALHLSIDSYDNDIVKSLLDLGADANLRSSRELKTPLMHAMRHVADCLAAPASKYQYLEPARQNVLALLQYGARPDLTHELPGPGYTPAMLAAELDEIVLLKAFHNSCVASCLNQTYIDPVECKHVGLGHIATYFGSRNVLNYLRNELKTQQEMLKHPH